MALDKAEPGGREMTSSRLPCPKGLLKKGDLRGASRSPRSEHIGSAGMLERILPIRALHDFRGFMGFGTVKV